MLRFFADTSGKQDKGGRFVITAAGWLATDAQWARFEDQWSNALRDAGVKKFHATDFYNFRGEFAGWGTDRKRHVKFAKRFTAIAEAHAEFGVGLGWMVGDSYKSRVDPVFQEAREELPGAPKTFTPLMLVVTSVVARVALLPRKSGHTIDVVFEYERGIGHAIELLRAIKKSGKESWAQSFRSFSTSNKEQLPLQAADLLAHESWRSVCEVHYPSGRAERKSMQRLTKRDRVILATIPQSRYEIIAERYRASLASLK